MRRTRQLPTSKQHPPSWSRHCGTQTRPLRTQLLRILRVLNPIYPLRWLLTPFGSTCLRETLLQQSGSELQLDIGPPTPHREHCSKEKAAIMVRAATVSNDDEVVHRQQAWLQQRVQALDQPPFTLQRDCELLADPFGQCVTACEPWCGKLPAQNDTPHAQVQ